MINNKKLTLEKELLAIAKYHHARKEIIKAFNEKYPKEHDLELDVMIELLKSDANEELIEFLVTEKLSTITIKQILGDDFTQKLATEQRESKKPLQEIVNDIYSKRAKQSLRRYERYAKTQRNKPPSEELTVVTDARGNEYYLQPKEDLQN